MTQAIDRKKELFAELDGLLEDEIKARLAAGIWGDEKRRLVRLYLDDKALARTKVEQAEQVAIARSAKNAAWVAAIFAGIAALAAIIALFA